VTLREFLTLIRQYWKTWAAVFLTVLALGVVWLVLSPPQYVSRTQLLVTINGTTTANAYQNDAVVGGRVKSYVPLLTSDVVGQRVVDKLGLKMSPAQLASKVSAVQVPPNTAIIDIAVSDPSPERARQIAGTVADEFVAYTATLESPTGGDAQKVQTKIVSQASQPRSRLGERIAIGGLVAVLAALAGAVAVWIRSAMQRARAPRHAITDLPEETVYSSDVEHSAEYPATTADR
jgi:capsular polysaccharide biosynthesis protein